MCNSQWALVNEGGINQTSLCLSMEADLLAELAETSPDDPVITIENKFFPGKHSSLLACTFPPWYLNIKGVLRKRFSKRMTDDYRSYLDLNC